MEGGDSHRAHLEGRHWHQVQASCVCPRVQAGAENAPGTRARHRARVVAAAAAHDLAVGHPARRRRPGCRRGEGAPDAGQRQVARHGAHPACPRHRQNAHRLP